MAAYSFHLMVQNCCGAFLHLRRHPGQHQNALLILAAPRHKSASGKTDPKMHRENTGAAATWPALRFSAWAFCRELLSRGHTQVSETEQQQEGKRLQKGENFEMLEFVLSSLGSDGGTLSDVPLLGLVEGRRSEGAHGH